jgi:large subunit ribosomal protein L22
MAEATTEATTIDASWIARHRFARMAPRKVRLVMDLIRGVDCQNALDILAFNPRRPSGPIRNLIKAAMASANEEEANMGSLYVSEARVDEGPTMNRWRPKDRGRAHPIKKRTSHLFVRISERD